MNIRVVFSGYYKRYIGGVTHIDLSLSEETATVRTTIQAAGLPPEDVGFVVVRGNRLDLDATVQDGDTLKVFPEILGG